MEDVYGRAGNVKWEFITVLRFMLELPNWESVGFTVDKGDSAIQVWVHVWCCALHYKLYDNIFCCLEGVAGNL